jgi:hypothetical protein
MQRAAPCLSTTRVWTQRLRLQRGRSSGPTRRPPRCISPSSPVNALAFEKDGLVEIHTGNQWQSSILPVLAKALRRSEDKIVLRSYLLGGGFGRRLDGDYAVPAALAMLAIGKPVKMVCTRADDMRFDCPRSASRRCVWPGATETRWRLWITTRRPVGPRLRSLLISWVKTLRALRTIHSPSREPTTGTTLAHTACARCRTIWLTGHSGLAISDP